MNLFTDFPLLMGASGTAASGSPASMTPTLVTFGLVFLIFYFLIIRPQNKRQKESKQMLESLKKGDRVVTIGGIRGSITSLKDDVVVLKVDDTTKIQFSRSAISSVVDAKGGKPAADVADESEDDEKNS